MSEPIDAGTVRPMRPWNALAPRPGGGELRAWQPGIMDNVRSYVANALSPLFGGDVRAANAFYMDKVQPTAEFLPGIGDAMAAGEAADEFGRGNYGMGTMLAAGAAAGLVPGVGDAVQKGIKAAVKSRGDEVLGLLKAGRADEITDDMLDMGNAADNANLNAYLFENYDLPMDEASRMGRAEDAGFMDNYETYHGTGDDIQAFRTSFRPVGENSSENVGVYSAYNPSVAETYAPNVVNGNIMPLATKTTIDDVIVEAGGANWNDIPMDAEVSRSGGNSGPLSDIFPDAQDSTGNARTNSIAAAARRDGAGSLRVNNTHDIGGFYDNKAGFNNIPPHDVRTDFYPHNIRSRFARFDPRLKHLRNLSAGVGGGALVLNALTNQQQPPEQY